MATQVESDPEVGVSTLISGIVEDARRLMVEQLTLFQVEIKNDIKRTFQAVIPIVAGAIVSFAGMILLGIAVAYLLCWAFPDLPVWGGFAIVGGVVAGSGVGLVVWGTMMLSSVNPLPEVAMKELKENIQWITKK